MLHIQAIFVNMTTYTMEHKDSQFDQSFLVQKHLLWNWLTPKRQWQPKRLIGTFGQAVVNAIKFWIFCSKLFEAIDINCSFPMRRYT